MFSILLLLVVWAVWAHRGGRVQTQADVVYGTAGGQPLRLDVYTPDASAHGSLSLRPAVLLIHGGGWREGSKTDNQAFCELLARNGYVAFSVDYRLATPMGNHYPAQFDDVQRAVRWVRAHAAQYHIDPARLGAFGHSAGAQLAALLGTCDTRDNSDPALARFSSRVACVVDTSGPTDFTDPAHPPLFPDTMPLLDTLFGRPRALVPALYREASPMWHVSRASRPFLIFIGTQDTLVPPAQGERLAQALRRVGVEADVIRVEDGHLFAKPENQRLWAVQTLAFLDRHLKPAQPPTKPEGL